MSSISSLSPTTSTYNGMNQTGVSPLIQDFNALGSALKTGDLTTAKSALADFQKVLQSSMQTSASQPFGKNSQANTDFQSLTSDLQSGNLAGAQKAFSSLQNDVTTAQSAQATTSAHIGHHHHHASNTASSTSSATASAASSIGTSILNSGLNTVA
ncbi:MAG: hypothetical protein ABSH48_05585 [Verrucomicrobiota bacterium]